MPFCHRSMFCKVDVLKKIGMFDSGNKIASDYEVFLKLLLGGYSRVKVNSCIACFRCGGASGDRVKLIDEYCDVLKKSFSKLYQLSNQEAYNIVVYSSLPLKLVFRVSKYLKGMDKLKFISMQFRHFIFQIRTSRKNRMLKLFGFYLIRPAV